MKYKFTPRRRHARRPEKIDLKAHPSAYVRGLSAYAKRFKAPLAA